MGPLSGQLSPLFSPKISASAAGAFDAMSVAPFELWYDAAQNENASNVSATNGQAVARALNRGSLGGYFTQTDAGRRATHLAAPPALDFPASGNGYLTSPVVALSSQSVLSFFGVIDTTGSSFTDYTPPVLFTRGGAGGINATGLSFNGGKMGFTWNDASETWGWTGGVTLPSNARCAVAGVIDASGVTATATVYCVTSALVTTIANTIFPGPQPLSGSGTTWDVGRDPFQDRHYRGAISHALLLKGTLTQTQIETLAQGLL